MMKSESPNVPLSLPDTFLKLDSALRRESLDLAWKYGLEQVEALPVLPAASAATNQGCSSYVLATLFLIAVFFILASVDVRMALVFLVILIVFFGIRGGIREHSREQLILQATKNAKAQADYQQNLKNLALSFVQSQFKVWINEMDKSTEKRALQEANVSPDSKFTLFSVEPSLRSSGIPYRRLGVTYIFSNGLISIVTDIEFNIEATSYSFINSDEPSFCITTPDSWSLQEFHYRDVVELDYRPASSHPEVVKSSGTEYPVEGFLILGLVSGSKRQYATTKNSITNFLSVAREKVRRAKSS